MKTTRHLRPWAPVFLPFTLAAALAGVATPVGCTPSPGGGGSASTGGTGGGAVPVASGGAGGGGAPAPSSTGGSPATGGSPGEGGSMGIPPGEGGNPGRGGAGAPVPAPDAPADMTPAPAAGELTIFWSDAEGGASTILHAPTGEIMVVDAGFPGTRDAARVVSIIKDELKSTKVDHLLLTHYHNDHYGGIGHVARSLTVGEFMDHGDGGIVGEYRDVIGNKKRRIIKAGDKLDLGAVKVTFVSSARQLIKDPLPGASSEPNPHCAGADRKGGDDENAASVGLVASFGAFDVVILGDLLWPLEHDLACPVNRLGKVEIYQATHHAQAQSGPPQLIRAMEPLAAVVNNGTGKGGAASALGILANTPSLADNVWQLHRGGGNNTTDDRIANLTDHGRYIKAVVKADGSFTVINPRNNHMKTYQSR